MNRLTSNDIDQHMEDVCFYGDTPPPYNKHHVVWIRDMVTRFTMTFCRDEDREELKRRFDEQDKEYGL